LTSAWAFAVAAWGRPGVEAICLELQNAHGQLPALLLWRWWTLDENRAVGVASLARAIQTARDWDGAVLRPLRAIRQRLAASSSPAPEPAREAVRRLVLEAELEAEHALIDALETLGSSRGSDAPPRLAAMIEVAAAWCPPAPSEALARLCEAL
jgi:uncharacterized protein (TIGR02444 family)